MLATAHFYENVRTDHPYTHKQQVKNQKIDGYRQIISSHYIRPAN